MASSPEAVVSEGRAGLVRRRWACVALWSAAGIAAAILMVSEWRSAAEAGIGTDLGYFLDAARRVVLHESVYGASEYVYSPMIAWILAPFAASSTISVWWAGVVLAGCLTAIIAMMVVLWPVTENWQRPLLALVMVVTMLCDATLGTELRLGQVDTVVLAVVAVSLLLQRLRRPVVAGAVLAIAALVKTWPILFALWLLRKSADGRRRAIAGFVGTVLFFLVIVLVVDGPQECANWFGRTRSMSSQHFAVWSATGVGRELFTVTGDFIPIADLPALATMIGLALGAYVVLVLALVLWRPGDAILSLWHVVMASVLLLPVSHLQYFLLFVPLLWVWAAYAIRDRWRGPALVAVIAMAARWVAPYVMEAIPVDSRWKYLAVMTANLVALGVSAVCASRYIEDAVRSPATG